MSKALAICLLPLVLTACAKPRATAPLPRAVNLLARSNSSNATSRPPIAVPGVERGVWGVVVHSLDRDERLFDLNPRTLLVPASPRSSYQRHRPWTRSAGDIGSRRRCARTVHASSDGTLSGDVFVVGTGDPTIGGRGGDDLTGWIDALEGSRDSPNRRPHHWRR